MKTQPYNTEPQDQSTTDFRGELLKSIAENKTRTRRRVDEHRQVYREFESAMDEKLRETSATIQREWDGIQSRSTALDERENQVREEIKHLGNLKTDLAEQHDTWKRLQSEAAEQQSTLLAEIHDQFRQLEECRASMLKERRVLDEQQAALTEAEDNVAANPVVEIDQVDRTEFDRVEAERNELSDRLLQVEKELKESLESNEFAGADPELESRLAMALEDIRGLKSRNSELEQELTEVRESNSKPVSQTMTGLDWEAMKQRMMEKLESDDEFESDSEEGTAEEKHSKIENLINATDRLVSEKDREIVELQKLLDQQSNSIGDVAVGAAAIGGMLDQDALIQDERENLRRLQEEWHEKLRAAEIEISTERAKLARDKNELEEQLLAIKRSGGESTTDEDHDQKPQRKHWLSRLGLTDSRG